MKDVLNHNPNIAYNLMMFYSNELRTSESKIKKMAQMNVTEKVADSLLYLKLYFGIINDEGIIIDADISRQDIADLAGINKEQLSKVLSDFKKESLIKIIDKKIHIVNLKLLNKYVDPFNG